jgi:hypothetical protein
MVVLFFLVQPALAQNTKGDRAETSGTRQSRFKGKKTKKVKVQKGYNRVQPGRFSLSNLARPFQKQRKPGTGVSKDNLYPQNGAYVHNTSKTPNKSSKPVSNRATLARLNRLQGSPTSNPPGKKKKVTPRSASRSFIRHKTINANAGFWNVRKKGEQAITTDLAGKPLRTKNFRTPPQEIIPSTTPYFGKRRVGDRAYDGATSGNFVRVKPKSRSKAWRGDIAGRSIRRRNFTSKQRIEGIPIQGGKATFPGRGDRVRNGKLSGSGYQSATQRPEKRTGKAPLPVRIPGVGADGVNYSGRLKGQRPLKGGGSRSGRHWNNNGIALAKRVPGIGADGVGTFQGNVKGQRPLKGGGSRSGRTWNNNGVALAKRVPGIGADRIGGFQGNIIANRPKKGGGTRSGKHWNNNEAALARRVPGIGADRVGTFQGNIKTGRPLKGGGSRSGKLWNNNGIPLAKRVPGIGADGIGGYKGNIPTNKPAKGGGSISGTLWNNKQTPIPVRTPPESARKTGGFPGNQKLFEQSPGFLDQGESFTGYIKLPKFKKSYVQNPKANEASIRKRRIDKKALDIDDLGIKVKRRDYVANKNSAEEALYKLKPTETTKMVDNLQIKVKRRDYVVNKNADDAALRKLKPTEATKNVGNLQVKVKQYRYLHNPSSAKEALHVREPGKAFARASDYQGNIRMKKFDLFPHRNPELHPDSKFVKTNKNNVEEERDLLTNLKLWWARNFRKSETQPDHLKEKERKPRYDKGEQGMWNE